MHNTDTLNIQDMERTAFSLFSRESSDTFKRAVCYLVLAELNKNDGPVSLSRLQQSISMEFGVRSEDIRSALSVLKCPAAFKAIHMWSHKTNRNVTLIRSVKTEEIESWLSYIRSDYPHIADLVH